jgi:hypothetical protein
MSTQQYGTIRLKDICVVTVGKKDLWEFIHLWCFIFTLEEKLKVLVEETPKHFYCSIISCLACVLT